MMREIQRRTRHVFVWLAALPLLLGILTLWAAAAYRDRIALVSHTREVLNAIDDLVLNLKGAESSQRGYLITGDTYHLSAYRAAGEQAKQALASLRSLTVDNDRQLHHLDALSPLVSGRLRRMQEVIDAHSTSRPSPAEWKAAMEEGNRLSESIDRITRNMTSEEDRLLQQRQASQARMERFTVGAFLCGFAICIALLFWAERLVRQYGLARDRAEAGIRELNTDLARTVEQVHQLNTELEQRVKIRTAELQAINERLLRSNEDLASFAYVASHDLQEPLRMIGSYAGLLSRRYQGSLDERADAYIRYVVDGAKRMQMLVQDLLTYSRAGTQALHWNRTAVQSVFEQSLQNLRSAAVEAGALITHDDLPEIEVDAGKLTQVLQNLIANAIKFRKQGDVPRVHLGARLSGDEWLFTVQDNGIGFEPEYAEKIFVIFQRLHGVGAYPGTGIGLAISKRIVEAHGGRIWATSQPGGGTTVSFTIPVHGHLQQLRAGSS
jgi:signal transduction histidine kinase